MYSNNEIKIISGEINNHIYVSGSKDRPGMDNSIVERGVMVVKMVLLVINTLG